MLMFLLLLVSFSGYLMFLKHKFWDSSIETLPLFIVSGMISLLYICSLLGILQLGAYILFLFGRLLLVYFLFSQRRVLFGSITLYLTPGIIVFLIAACLIYLKYRNANYSIWDEFSHWGFAIKEMFYRNSLPTAESALRFKEYPPGTALFHYYFTKILGYSEGNTYVAQNFLLASAITTFFSGFKWKNISTAVGTVVLSYLVLVSFTFENSINSLYADPVVGVFFGTTIVYYFCISKQRNLLLKMLPVMFVLPLFKQIGIVLSAILSAQILSDMGITAYYSVNGVSFRERLTQLFITRRRSLTGLVMVILLIIAPFLTSDATWNNYVKNNGFKPVFQTSFSLADVQRSFSQNANKRDTATKDAFRNALLNAKISSLPMPKLTIVRVIIGITLCFLITILLPVQNIGSKRIISCYIWFLFGFIGYAGVHLVLYLYSFSEYEAVRVASFERYMGVYFIGWALVAVYFLMAGMKNILEKKWNIVGSVILILLLSRTNPFNIAKSAVLATASKDLPLTAVRQEIKGIMAYVDPKVAPKSKVYVIWQNTKGLEYYILQYELAPRLTNVGYLDPRGSWSLGKPYYEQDIWTSDMTPSAWAKVLQEYDYVLIGHADENFWQTYGSLFKGPRENQVLFRVQKENGSVNLINI